MGWALAAHSQTGLFKILKCKKTKGNLNSQFNSFVPSLGTDELRGTAISPTRFVRPWGTKMNEQPSPLRLLSHVGSRLADAETAAEASF